VSDYETSQRRRNFVVGVFVILNYETRDNETTDRHLFTITETGDCGAVEKVPT
jgi:hypothetical protein